MPKYCFVFATLIALSLHSFSQTDCKQYYYENAFSDLDYIYTPKLITLPNGDVVFGCMKGNNLVVIKLNYRGDSIWDKIYSVPGGFNMTYSRGLLDIDGNLLFAVTPGYFLKIDTAGNVISTRNIHNVILGVSDMVMLPNGDKVILFISNSLPFIALFNPDLTAIKWCKSFPSYNSFVTNLLLDGNTVVVGKTYMDSNYPYNYVSSIIKFSLADGSVVQNQVYSLPGAELQFTDLIKCGSGYIAAWRIDKVDSLDGNRGYLRVDSLLNIKGCKRITNYTSGISTTTFAFQGMPDGSFYYAYGEVWNLTLGLVGNDDKSRWVKDIPGLFSYPFDLKLANNKKGLYITGRENDFFVGVNLEAYTAYVLLCDLNGNLNICTPETKPSAILTDFSVNSSPQSLATADTTLLIDNIGVTGMNYFPQQGSRCKSISTCDSIHVKGDSAICNTIPALFTAARNINCTSPVYWSIIPSVGTVMNYPDDTTLSVVFNTSGNYHVAAYILRSCGDTIHDSFTVHVNLLAKLNLGVDTFICSNSSLILHAGNQFASYRWQDGSSDSLYKVVAPGQYFVTVEDYCNNTFSDTINVNDVAAAAFHVMNDTTKCNGDSIRLTAPGGFLNYTWSPDYNITNDTGEVVNAFPDTSISYIASAFTPSGCFVSDTINIYVNHSPKIILPDDTSLCANQTVILNAGNGFNNYLWNTGDTTSTLKVFTAGVYIVKASDRNQCISKDTFSLLNVYPLPAFSLGNDTTLCDEQQLTYNLAIPQASYLWSTGNTSNMNTINSAGIYWLQVTSQVGCVKDDTINVAYKPLPKVSLGSDTALCNGIDYTLDAFYAGSTYTWQDGSTLPQFTVTNAGLYYVAVDLNGCFAKESIEINYLDKPSFNLGKDTVLCEGTTITLHPQLNTSAGYTWQDGTKSTQYIVRNAGTYELTGTNACGTFSDDIIITSGLCNIEMPNIFTPNNDGLNDIFRVKYPFSVITFLFTVYNRFGEKVFETTDMNKGWDGSYRGMAQQVGSYVWIIQLVPVGKPPQSYKGVVNLIR